MKQIIASVFLDILLGIPVFPILDYRNNLNKVATKLDNR